MLGSIGTRDDVRDLFTREGLSDVYDWAEDVLGDVIEIVTGDLDLAVLVTPATLVVDGNLRVTGDIEVSGLLIVMGDVTAHAFRCTGSAFVQRDLTLAGTCTTGDAAALYCQTLDAHELVGDPSRIHAADVRRK
jgi:hypothetical protein